MVKSVKLRALGRGAQVAISPDDLAYLGWKQGDKVFRVVERTPEGGRVVLEKAPPMDGPE